MLHPRVGIKTADLQKAPLTRPTAAGDYWEGIPHHVFVETVKASLRKRGVETTKEIASTSADGQDLAVYLGVRADQLIKAKGGHPDGAYEPGLVIVTSNARRTATKAWGGITTQKGVGFPLSEVCKPLKHTTGNTAEEIAETIVAGYVSSSKSYPKIVQRLKDTVITPMRLCYLLVWAGREKIMPWSRVGVMDVSLRTKEEVWNGLDLLEAFAVAGKKNSALVQTSQANRFREMVLSIDKPYYRKRG